MFVCGLVAPGCGAPAREAQDHVRPLRGIFYSEQNLKETRQCLHSEPWRLRLHDEITSAADKWVARDDEWIRTILPPPGSVFAYGVNGCPKCDAKWKNFGADTCSFDRPGKVVCPGCKTVFPDPDPASPYHDTGTGVAVNGKRYYLAGVWNAFVIQSMHAAFSEDSCALNALAHAYALTGRGEYARKAAVIMDALATLAPSTRGPRDFDYSGSVTSDQGRLHFLTSIVYRALVPLARDYDLVGRHPVFQQDSPTSPGVTIAANVRGGLFEDYLFRHFDVRRGRLSTLHNHEADSVRAMLATGLLFGSPDYIRWGIDSLDSLLANTVDRDGMYYETSVGYAEFTRSVFVDMAELCATYSPERFADLPGDFPPARNFFAGQALKGLVVDNFDLTVAGQDMNFGNSHTSRSVLKGPSASTPWNLGVLSRFLAYSPDPGVRDRVRRMLASGMAGQAQGKSGTRWWLLKMPEPLPEPLPSPEEESPVGSGKFFSTKALAAFQSGEWPERRGFCVRGGPNLPHAHDDLLGLNLYDVGRELSAEIGYSVFDSHVHKGWGTRAIAHNLVTVDGDAGLTGNEYFKKSPGASWRSFYDGGDVKFIDADGSSQFPGRLPVTKYRRRVAMVDVTSSASYYLDVFDVRGGSNRDYSLHAPYNDKLLTAALSFEGVDMRPVEGAWTLAGLDPQWRDAPWNRQGRSWGERVTPGEYIRKVTPDDGVGPYGWVAPGRGYGFLYNLRGGAPSGAFRATWALEGQDNAFLRATFLPAGAVTCYAANAPDLSGSHLLNYVICRDSGTSDSRFVVLLEPYRGAGSVREARLLAPGTRGDVVVEIALADGRTDYVAFAEPESKPVIFDAVGGGTASSEGEFAFVRLGTDGKPEVAHMFRGSRLSVGAKVLLSSVPAVRGTITATDEVRGRLVAEVDRGAEVAAATRARFAVVSSPRYTHDTGIQISENDVVREGGNRLSLRTGRISLQKVRIAGRDDDGVTTSSIPLPLTFIHDRPTSFLDGKALVTPDGKVAGRIARSLDIGSFATERGAAIREGDDLRVMDFVAGDSIELPIGASWRSRR